MYHDFQEEVEGTGAMGENRREKRGKKKIKVQQARTAKQQTQTHYHKAAFSVVSKKLCVCS